MTNNSNSRSENVFYKNIEKKLAFPLEHSAVSLAVLGFFTVIIRLFYFPDKIPLSLDALSYFWYASDASILGHLPPRLIGNDGWPIFLSFFFSIFHSDNFIDYMVLQRLVTVSISSLTIIPLYFLSRRFFSKPYTLIATMLFAFDPRIIQNSLLGITDPIYLILLTTSLYLFFSDKKKIFYLSFFVAALCTIVRPEGIFLFISLSIMFFLRKKEDRKIRRYLLVAAIFALTILPMAILRTTIGGSDTTIGKIQGSTTNIIKTAPQHGGLLTYVISGFENYFKFAGWAVIPTFIFVVPVGFLLVLKNQEYRRIVIPFLVVMSLPALYAYASGAFDSRYLFPLYPIFCIISIFAIRFFFGKKNPYLVSILLIGGIVLSSGLFLTLKSPFDIEHEKEALNIAYYVANKTSLVDPYSTVAKYIPIAEMKDLKFPVLSSSVSIQTKFPPSSGFSSFDDYIKFAKEQGVTQLILDGSARDPILNDPFYHEGKYPYLERVYDSWDHGYKYHVRIYKINYEKFELS